MILTLRTRTTAEGEKVMVVECETPQEEMVHVAAEILHYMQEQVAGRERKYSDIAVSRGR